MHMKQNRSYIKEIDLIYVIDSRALERECFVRGIEIMQPSTTVEAFASAAEWLEVNGSPAEAGIILYNTEGRHVSETAVSSELGQLAVATDIPIVVLSPIEELEEMLAALECGAKGYIPASLGIEATLTAIRLTGAETVFMRAACLLGIRESFSRRIAAFPTSRRASPRGRAPWRMPCGGESRTSSSPMS